MTTDRHPKHKITSHQRPARCASNGLKASHATTTTTTATITTTATTNDNNHGEPRKHHAPCWSTRWLARSATYSCSRERALCQAPPLHTKHDKKRVPTARTKISNTKKNFIKQQLVFSAAIIFRVTASSYRTPSKQIDDELPTSQPTLTTFKFQQSNDSKSPAAEQRSRGRQPVSLTFTASHASSPVSGAFAGQDHPLVSSKTRLGF